MKTCQARTLALLDIENLIHGSPLGASVSDYVYSASLVAAHGDLTIADQVVVGVGSNNITGVFAAAEAWPGAALRCRSGFDGADRALCEHLADLEAIARSFDRVVIGSGDRYFIGHVVALNKLGVTTTVVSWSSKLSKRLRLAASEARILDAPTCSTEELSCVA